MEDAAITAEVKNILDDIQEMMEKSAGYFPYRQPNVSPITLGCYLPNFTTFVYPYYISISSMQHILECATKVARTVKTL